MLLKRLEVQGFKSFADKTVLEFGPGVTCVVGPNGSGKSNISDAIRWVMGEMSAKSLRGSNMQDVIFAGTEKRGRLSFAEVSLVLDNSERIFPLEYDEVVVTRRVFRSGETAYRINGSNCRLKDIHELFMDTGLGRDGYSIIGQGSVAQILSTKAEERRNLFEEAAGVSKYKYKKEEAERKLSQVEDNILRISDITTELEGQLAPLEKQSEKARKYLTYYEEYKGLDVNMSMVTLKKNATETVEVDKQKETVDSEINTIREKESETEAKITRLYDESKQKDDEQEEKNSELVETKSKISECSNAVSLAKNTVKNNETLILRVENEIKSEEEKNIRREEEIKALDESCEKNRELFSKEAENLSNAREESVSLAEKQDKINESLRVVREEISTLAGKISSDKTKTEGIKNLQSSYVSRLESLKAQKEALSSDIENTKRKIEESKKNASEKKQRLENLNKMIESDKQKKAECDEELSSLIERGNNLQVEFKSKSSKKKMLEAMENEYEGYSKSVKSILKSEELKKLSIYGTVAGLVEVKKEYSVAVEIALGAALQNIIVETEEDAKQAIGYLRKTNGGRATFLPISSIKGRNLENLNDIRKEEGFVGVASKLVSCNQKYEGIISNLLGRVVVVDNIDNGVKLSKKFGYKFKTVTLAGDVLNSGGSMTGGSVNKTSGFLSRAVEIKTLKGEISEIEREYSILSEKAKELKEQKGSITSRVESYISMKREYEDEVLTLENTVKHLENTIFTGADTESGFGREITELEEKISVSDDELIETLNSMRSAESKKREKDEELSVLEEEKQKADKEIEEDNREIIEKNNRLSEIRREIDSATYRIKQLKEDILAAKSEIEKKKMEKERISESNKELLKSAEEKQSQTSEFEEKAREINERIVKISEEKRIIVESLQKIQNSNKEITDTLLKLQQELSRVEAKQVKLSMEKENILSRLWDEYELTYSAAEEIATEPENIKEAASRLAELKGKIKALGSINIDSIEEYKSVSERYNLLSEQKKDLDKAKDDLGKIIDSMEDLMKEHFEEQFSAISESFSLVFRELFGGGRGRLYLQDPENVLESGIEIEVQLPGKGLQNINLYSGGEKSFIAIALLFAILRVKPSPFCILDEIDAALDDVNVSRFATYLKNYIDSSQFIVITHRRGSMEAANILYGVTMQEKGVSKLLSLHIDDVDESMAE